MESKRILIVEDEAIIALDMQLTLTQLGYEVSTTVSTGEEAIIMAERLQPDLILMDIQLGGELDGIDAAAIIHVQHDIPIIFLTAFIDEETLERAKEVEPYAYLTKPFERSQVKTNIDLALHQHQLYKDALQREKRLNLLTRNAFDILIQVDANGRILNVTAPIERIMGLSPRTMLSNHITAFLHPTERNAFTQIFQEQLQQQEKPKAIFSGQFLHANGTTRWVEIIINNMLDEPVVSAVVLNLRDITERKQQQEQLLQAQKLEAVGRLAGGIAHDFNNILTVIESYASLLTNQTELTDKRRHYAKQITNASQKASQLAKRLLVFTEQNVGKHERLNLNQLISGLVPLIRRLLPKDAELTLDLANRPIWIDGNEGQLDQLIFNLVSNASDAMGKNGKLKIKTETAVFPSKDTHTYCLLTIQDNGRGIEPTVHSQIFEPFFSTKSKRQSAGLGLSIVHAIVSQHQGHITVNSQPDEGTVFQIFLPIRPETVQENKPYKPLIMADPQGAQKTILLVEDDPMVRELMSHILRESGYHLLIAQNSQEALSLSTTKGLIIDFLVTDIVMPGELNGRHLAEKLQQTYPRMSTLFVSGYTDNALQGELQLHHFRFLAKPFTPNQLLEDIQALAKSIPIRENG